MMNDSVYINGSCCISQQMTFENPSFLEGAANAIRTERGSAEPDYKDHIPRKYLRRMGRMVRMGVCAARVTLKEAEVEKPEAILVGTGMGCMEDTEEFLSAIYANDEQNASPNQFIQSTHNNVAAQIAIMLECYAYNFTYVHRGFSFESALMDAMMHLKESNSEVSHVLVGASDELTDTYNDITDRLNRVKSHRPLTSLPFALGEGSVQGEGAAFFSLSNVKTSQSKAKIDGLEFIYKPTDQTVLQEAVTRFLARHGMKPLDIDFVLLGYSGNCDETTFDNVVHQTFKEQNKGVFKHLCGEFKTAGAFATWLAAEMIHKQHVPEFVRMNQAHIGPLKNVLVFNNYNSSNYIISLLSHV